MSPNIFGHPRLAFRVEVRTLLTALQGTGQPPTVKSDLVPAGGEMSHQHPWSRALPRPKHKTTCVGPWDFGDENGRKIIQLHFQLVSKRRSLQRNAIKKVLALQASCAVLRNPRASLRVWKLWWRPSSRSWTRGWGYSGGKWPPLFRARPASPGSLPNSVAGMWGLCSLFLLHLQDT